MTMRTLDQEAELLNENREKRLELVEALATNHITLRSYQIQMMALANSEARRIAQQLGKTN